MRSFENPRRHVFVGASLFIFPATVAANPVSFDPAGGLGKGFGIAAVTFALAVEVTATAAAAIWLCKIEQPRLLAISFALLNLASYFLFIRLLHPLIGKIAVTELLISITEAIAILVITGLLSAKPLSPKRALALSFLGNLLSFLVGYGA